MKVKVGVLLGIQGVFEVEAVDLGGGKYALTASLDGSVDIKSTCIAGGSNQVGLSPELRKQMVAEAEQALAQMVGQNYRPADKGAKTDLIPVTNTVN